MDCWLALDQVCMGRGWGGERRGGERGAVGRGNSYHNEKHHILQETAFL